MNNYEILNFEEKRDASSDDWIKHNLSVQALELAYNIRCDTMSIKKNEYIFSWIKNGFNSFNVKDISPNESDSSVRFYLSILVVAIRDSMKLSMVDPFMFVRYLDLSNSPLEDRLVIDILNFSFNKDSCKIEILNLSSCGITDETLLFLSNNISKFQRLSELYLGSIDKEGNYICINEDEVNVQKLFVINKGIQEEFKKETLYNIGINKISKKSENSYNNVFSNAQMISFVSSLKFYSDVLRSLSIIDLRANGYSLSASEEIYSLVRSTYFDNSFYGEYNSMRNRRIELLGFTLFDEKGNAYDSLVKQMLRDMNSDEFKDTLLTIKTESICINFKKEKLSEIAQITSEKVDELSSKAKNNVERYLTYKINKAKAQAEKLRRENMIEKSCQVSIEQNIKENIETINTEVQTDIESTIESTISVCDVEIQTEEIKSNIQEHSHEEEEKEKENEKEKQEEKSDSDSINSIQTGNEEFYELLDQVIDDRFLEYFYDANEVENFISNVEDNNITTTKQLSKDEICILENEGRISVGNTFSMLMMCGVLGKTTQIYSSGTSQNTGLCVLWLSWDMDKLLYANANGDKDTDILKAMQTSSKKVEIVPSCVTQVELSSSESGDVVTIRYSERKGDSKEFKFIPIKVQERGVNCLRLLFKEKITLATCVAECVRFVSSLSFNEKQTMELLKKDVSFHALAHRGCPKIPFST